MFRRFFLALRSAAPPRSGLLEAVFFTCVLYSGAVFAQDEILYFNGPNANVGRSSTSSPDAPPISNGSFFDTPAAPEDDSESIDLNDKPVQSAPHRSAGGCSARNWDGTGIGMTADAVNDLKKANISPCSARDQVMSKIKGPLFDLSRALTCPAQSEPAGKALFAERQKEVNEESFIARVRAKGLAPVEAQQEQKKKDDAQRPWWMKILAPFFDPVIKKFAPSISSFNIAPRQGASNLIEDDLKTPLDTLSRLYFGQSSAAQYDFARIAKICPAWNTVSAAENAPQISIVRVSARPEGGQQALVMLRQVLGPYSSARAPILVPLDDNAPLADDYMAWSGYLSDAALARSHAESLRGIFGDSAMHWAAGRSGASFDAPPSAADAAAIAAAASAPSVAQIKRIAKPKPRVAPAPASDDSSSELEFVN